ncbi:MAG: glycoside hydrolase family 13 protein [Ignavibacteriales bacterium]|nr:glycoside hydrolase family 13 protein [Ignavibacteriales bacterium]
MSLQRFIVYLFLIIISINTIVNSQHIIKVPAWTKQAIWYQIFPERFFNGDKSNDPKPIDLEGGWPYDVPAGWQIHPWTSDWYKLQPWEVKDGHDFYWNAGVRRYGGDLQGILNKLDYLKQLGINAIYLNPIFESPSLHKYDASMYHHIDNNFGPNPEKDRELWTQENPDDSSTWKWTTADKLFLKLISECHKRGIKIIIDGVFNHVGTTFWAFKDVVKNQQKSKHKDWFVIKSWDDPNTPKNEFDYEGWAGIKDLPRFRQDENGIVSGPKEHIHAIIKRWMEPNGNPSDGIDGWRLDVAEQVNHNFWKTFRTWVKEINSDAYIVGEIFWDDWQKDKMMDAGPWLHGDEFDAVMNYRFARALKEFVLNKKDQIGPQGFIDSLNTLYKKYPIENNYVMMNLLDSHDVERVSSMIVNPDLWYDHDGNPSNNKNYDVRKPTDQERLKQKLVVGLQFMLPGAPQVYYGDEAGMWGGDDPDCRKPMVWPELNYDTETNHPFGLPRVKDEVEFDKNIFDWYKKIIAIRTQNKVLALGDIKFNVIDENKKILGFSREFKGDKIFIILNNNSSPNKISLVKNKFMLDNNSYTDLINGNMIRPVKGNFNFELKPYQIMILKSE